MYNSLTKLQLFLAFLLVLTTFEIVHVIDEEYLIVFDRVACWARPLEGKTGIETARIFGSALTLGIGEISRATTGNSNHWAFIAKGNKKFSVWSWYKWIFSQDDSVYYVAQFGVGELTGNEFNGDLMYSLEDAVKRMNTNGANTWVVRPKNMLDKWDYVYNDGVLTEPSELSWKECAPITYKELKTLIAKTRAISKPYNFLLNNCQHLAEEIFDQIL